MRLTRKNVGHRGHGSAKSGGTIEYGLVRNHKTIGISWESWGTPASLGWLHESHWQRREALFTKKGTSAWVKQKWEIHLTCVPSSRNCFKTSHTRRGGHWRPSSCFRRNGQSRCGSQIVYSIWLSTRIDRLRTVVGTKPVPWGLTPSGNSCLEWLQKPALLVGNWPTTVCAEFGWNVVFVDFVRIFSLTYICAWSVCFHTLSLRISCRLVFSSV